MRICGIKATHDAAVAVIDNGKLLMCTELEKVSNGDRYRKLHSMGEVHGALFASGIDPASIDRWVLDGWKHQVTTLGDGTQLVGAPYDERDQEVNNILHPFKMRGDRWWSYRHVAGHIMGTYASSPFSSRKQEAYVICWDGGMQPRLYRVVPEEGVKSLGPLFNISGILYTLMSLYWGPYKDQDVIDHRSEEGWYELASRKASYDHPGKIMAYIANGTAHDYLVQQMRGLYNRLNNDLPRGYDHCWSLEGRFLRALPEILPADYAYTDADMLASLHSFLQSKLVLNAISAMPKGSNLCFTGGSALNIKWNTALRASEHFRAVWVPPFPNDCGSAIGTACCDMAVEQGLWHLEWSVYSGPALVSEAIPEGWKGARCTVNDLASILATDPLEPIVVLYGKSEIGPRALGHRSILCSAVFAENKMRLNSIKGREDFRPVSPICLEEFAPIAFDPGTPDPYMLFEHRVRREWTAIIPAILHLDGSARLQTVGEHDSPFIRELLQEYQKWTVLPILCNTSANYKGKGFFPDAISAMEWGRTKYVWADGELYTKKGA